MTLIEKANKLYALRHNGEKPTITIDRWVQTFNKTPDVQFLLRKVLFDDYGFDFRRIQVFIPEVGFIIDPVKLEDYIDELLTKYEARV